jgi:hypothetical protein
LCCSLLVLEGFEIGLVAGPPGGQDNAPVSGIVLGIIAIHSGNFAGTESGLIRRSVVFGECVHG